MATGDFELLALIAEGGQGAVHLVWDRARGEPRAPLAQLVRECLYTKAEKRPGLAQLVERLPGEWASQLAALVRRVGPGPQARRLRRGSRPRSANGRHPGAMSGTTPRG